MIRSISANDSVEKTQPPGCCALCVSLCLIYIGCESVKAFLIAQAASSAHNGESSFHLQKHLPECTELVNIFPPQTTIKAIIKTASLNDAEPILGNQSVTTSEVHSPAHLPTWNTLSSRGVHWLGDGGLNNAANQEDVSIFLPHPELKNNVRTFKSYKPISAKLCHTVCMVLFLSSWTL